MPAHPPSLVLASLLACAAVPAVARPGTGGGALHIGVRIIADCHAAGAHDTACRRPARQRSDGAQPVPAQVAALSPAIESTTRVHSPSLTVTY